VLVLHLYQSAILNRPAVAALGYAKDTPDPPGGQIVRDHAGNPTDVLLAAPAPFILYGVLGRLPVLDPDQQVSSTRHFVRELNRFGISSAIDGAGESQQFPATTPPSCISPAAATSACGSPTTCCHRQPAGSCGIWPSGPRRCGSATG
jgi:predicted amidohydrolase YtcJ